MPAASIVNDMSLNSLRGTSPVQNWHRGKEPPEQVWANARTSAMVSDFLNQRSCRDPSNNRTASFNLVGSSSPGSDGSWCSWKSLRFWDRLSIWLPGIFGVSSLMTVVLTPSLSTTAAEPIEGRGVYFENEDCLCRGWGSGVLLLSCPEMSNDLERPLLDSGLCLRDRGLDGGLEGGVGCRTTSALFSVCPKLSSILTSLDWTMLRESGLPQVASSSDALDVGLYRDEGLGGSSSLE